jgi:hypothetical protein
MPAATFVELFPIRRESLPVLYVYCLITSSNDLNTLGGKLSYWFGKLLGGS